jgi:hypothetical protein
MIYLEGARPTRHSALPVHGAIEQNNRHVASWYNTRLPSGLPATKKEA